MPMIKVTSALFETHSIIPHKPLSQAKINRWFKKLENGVSDLARKCLHRRMGLGIVDEVVVVAVVEAWRLAFTIEYRLDTLP